MIILGIDPGTAKTGWGLVSFDKQRKTDLIAYDCITTLPKQQLSVRLQQIYRFLDSLIKKYQPDCFAVEQLFFNTNAKTALKVGHARGVILLAAQQNGVKLFEYTPLQVKVAVTGYGRADKRQVQHMVKQLLHLDTIPKPDDAADAIAVALTCGFTVKF